MLIDYCCVTNNTMLSHIGDEENLKPMESWTNLALLRVKTGLNISSEWNATSWLMELLLLISNEQY